MKVLIIHAKNQHKDPHEMLITRTVYVVKQAVKLVVCLLATFCSVCLWS